MKNILVITTGGTIDAQPYQETPVDVSPLKNTMIPEALQILGLDEKCAVRPFCMKDSKYITHQDLQAIAQTIANEAENYAGFIITHGTDTAPENGRTLKKMLDELHITAKPVALTGAMQPLLNGTQPSSTAEIPQATSDGWANLHFAVSQISSQDAGVYVAFQDQMMPVEGLRKDFESKQFY